LKNILARAACSIARKINIYDLGPQIKEMHYVSSLNPILETNIIRGTVIYVDNYGNAITNISRSHFEL